MLRQSIEEARSCQTLARDRLDQITSRDKLIELDKLEIAKLTRIIEVSDKLIARLEKQCTTTSFLFGLIKFKKC